MTPEDEEFARIEAEIKRRQNDDGDTQEYAHQGQWVGLTDEEVMQTMSGDWTSQFYFARAIEAKLKEKNHDQ